MLTILKGAAFSKTVWVNVVILLSAVFAMDEIKAVISPEHLVMIQTVVNVVLRLVTDQSLAMKAVR